MNAAHVHDEQKVDILFDRDLNFVAPDEMGGRRETCGRLIKPIPEQAKEKECSFLKKRTKKLLLFEFCRSRWRIQKIESFGLIQKRNNLFEIRNYAPGCLRDHILFVWCQAKGVSLDRARSIDLFACVTRGVWGARCTTRIRGAPIQPAKVILCRNGSPTPGRASPNKVLVVAACCILPSPPTSIAETLPGSHPHDPKTVSGSRRQDHAKPPIRVMKWSFDASPAAGGLDIALPKQVPHDGTSSPGRSRGFAGLADEIIIVGERQRRPFMLVKPSEVLTGPQALDAAQPVVPWIGTVCSYKTLCFDESQPRLRGSIPRVLQMIINN